MTVLGQSGKGFISLMFLYNGFQPIVTAITALLKLEVNNYRTQSKDLNSEIIDS